MNDLIFLALIDGLYVNVTMEMRDYLRDPQTLNFLGAADRIYVGLYKPFNSLYVELNEVPVSPTGLTFRYSTDSGFQSLEVNDDTKGFERSGFWTWDRQSIQETWVESDVNGLSMFWVEIELATTPYDLSLKGVNIVFSDDYCMQVKSPFVMDKLPKNDTSFIRYHVAARDEIVQILRNGGYIKMPTGVEDLFFEPSNNRENITKWDLLDREEVKEAATFRAMSMVYFNESRNVQDKEYNLYRDYQGKFGQSFKLFYLSLDINDDGKVDTNEKLANNEVTVVYE